MNGIERLLTLRQSNEIRRLDMQAAGQRFARIAARHIEGTAPAAVVGFNLFQTPEPIAAMMAGIVRERVLGGRILEPSAGLGRLIEPLSEAFAEWVCVEESIECIRALRRAITRANTRTEARDFLGTTAEELGGKFDAVVMNPPFKQGRDIKHIQHALTMLRPGGRLVSLCYNGTRQQEQLRPMANRWEELPAGSFREEGTGASVALVVIDR